MKAVPLETRSGEPAKKSLRLDYNSWTVSLTIVSETGDRLVEDRWLGRDVRDLAENRSEGLTMEGDAIDLGFESNDRRFAVSYKGGDWNPVNLYADESAFCSAISDLGIADCVD